MAMAELHMHLSVMVMGTRDVNSFTFSCPPQLQLIKRQEKLVVVK